jgi:hypothetical protein
MTEDASEVIVCAGPPACPYTDDDAMANARAGCPLCRHIVIHPDGTETEYRKNSH